MKSFRQFLKEGGNATKKWETKRANQTDIEEALKFISAATGLSIDGLSARLLGSAALTFLGKKDSSGDVDIAIDHDSDKINSDMLKAVNDEGVYNAGTQVGSYAVPVNGKKIQVDLMTVSDKDWASWIYHSEEGTRSKYQGVVRNIILFTTLAYTQEPGKDFVIRGDDGKSKIRASKSIIMSTGMQRLFKMAKLDSDGNFGKTIVSVTPAEIKATLEKLGKKIKFSPEIDHTNDPNVVAHFIFGQKVSADDLMTAEQVISHIKQLKNAAEIIKACKLELNRLKLPVPKELD